MKYSLRTLMIVVLVLPPLLAVCYFASSSKGLPNPLMIGIAVAIFFVSMRIALRGEFSP
jgi:hypothetical protein